MGPIVWKILAGAGAAAAALVANKAVDTAWSKTGQQRLDPRNPDAPLSKALLYASVTAFAVAAAQVIAERKAAEYYRKSAGHLPAGIKSFD